MQALHLAAIIELVLSRSKVFLKPKGAIADLDQYVLQMWTGQKKKDVAMRLASADDLRTSLTLIVTAADLALGLAELQRIGAICPLTVDDARLGSVNRLLAMPECIPLLDALERLGSETVTPSALLDLYVESRRISEEASRRVVVVQRIQAHLSDNSAPLTSKMAVFAMFLLLAGATSEDTALVLKQRDSKEYQYQAKIVEYLNYVGARLYGPGFSGNPRREFKVGTLMDDLERRGQLERQFGSTLFRWQRSIGTDGAELYYFDLSGFLGEDSSLEYVLRKLLRKIHTGSGVADFASIVKDLIRTFWFTSPIDLRRVLFRGEANSRHYETLDRVSLGVLDSLSDSDGSEADADEADEE